MAYVFNVEKKSSYLYVTVTGDNTVESVMSYLTDAHVACEKFQCPFVLLEENLRGPALSIEQIFRVAGIVSANAFPTVRIVSCVDLNPEHIPLRMQIAASVVSKAGIQVRWHSTVEAAEKWLLESIEEFENSAKQSIISPEPPSSQS